MKISTTLLSLITGLSVSPAVASPANTSPAMVFQKPKGTYCKDPVSCNERGVSPIHSSTLNDVVANRAYPAPPTLVADAPVDPCRNAATLIPSVTVGFRKTMLKFIVIQLHQKHQKRAAHGDAETWKREERRIRYRVLDSCFINSKG